VTGDVKGNQAIFGFDFERDGNKIHASYTATSTARRDARQQSSSKVDGGQGGSGKWTAAKK